MLNGDIFLYDRNHLFSKECLFFYVQTFFTIHKFFRNSVYVGTCLIISRRGMLTMTCLSTLRICEASFFFFFLPLNALRNDGDVK